MKLNFSTSNIHTFSNRDLEYGLDVLKVKIKGLQMAVFNKVDKQYYNFKNGKIKTSFMMLGYFCEHFDEIEICQKKIDLIQDELINRTLVGV